MKSFEELDALCDCIIRYKLPESQIIFMNWKQELEISRWFKSLGGAAVAQVTIPNTSAPCDTIEYRGMTFYFIGTNYSDPIPHLHDWEESKTFFKEIDTDTYILSRYCKRCGKAETYHGTDKKWIETGYLKLCHPPE